MCNFYKKYERQHRNFHLQLVGDVGPQDPGQFTISSNDELAPTMSDGAPPV